MAYEITGNEGRSVPNFNVGEITAEEGMGPALADKRNVLMAQAMTVQECVGRSEDGFTIRRLEHGYAIEGGRRGVLYGAYRLLMRLAAAEEPALDWTEPACELRMLNQRRLDQQCQCYPAGGCADFGGVFAEGREAIGIDRSSRGTGKGGTCLRRLKG